MPAYPISSLRAFGSVELKKASSANMKSKKVNICASLNSLFHNQSNKDDCNKARLDMEKKNKQLNVN